MKDPVKVTVKFYGSLRHGGGEWGEEVKVAPGTTVKAVVDLFTGRDQSSPEGSSRTSVPANLEETYGIMLNGISLERGRQSTATVQEGDRITIFFPISGG